MIHRTPCWAVPVVLMFGLVAGGAGCASNLTRVEAAGDSEGAYYRHEERGYRISAPEDAESGWQRVEVDGADLAFRARDRDSTMTLIVECTGKPADPMILARHLVIGVPERDLRQAGPALVDGVRAWSQTFDTQLDGVDVRVKTVTSDTAGCSYDWVLVASGDFERVEHDFDAWWLSFRYRLPDREAPAPAGPAIGETVVGDPAGPKAVE